jgi:hypothetical protein
MEPLPDLSPKAGRRSILASVAQLTWEIARSKTGHDPPGLCHSASPTEAAIIIYLIIFQQRHILPFNAH